ncbi:actin-binding Rho-activating protein-like isoform X1 [Brienomyrus brachyistius]|uniref:actin-binding Rho-activating protein-like isoform X1 n=2 Tax=Brienomyrus brachyistius TaxID=42636 RepID=UPI0020B29F83|nr:actin-binding Rho-activating protein-like isoform X1 [Brienomyrus brachyistius]
MPGCKLIHCVFLYSSPIMNTDNADDTGNTITGSCASSVKGLKDSWQNWSSDHREYQKHNPFSDGREVTARIRKGQAGYGRPQEGSKTEQRGFDAHSHIGREVKELCDVIKDIGERREDGTVTVEFGRLFECYVSISNKVVGVLLRARRQGLVHFDGEMLWQGQDDGVLITLLQ